MAVDSSEEKGQVMQLFFVSRNSFKQMEARLILSPLGIDVEADHTEINELQTVDTDLLVRDKAARAFKKLGRPLFVEHTGLYLDLLNGFPGGLTQIFWDSLKKERFSKLFAHDTHAATARTTIGHVDGRRVHLFHGEIVGRIVNPPRIDHGFQWDCVFVPEGYKQSFSEMGDAKNDISMRRRALEALKKHLEVAA